MTKIIDFNSTGNIDFAIVDEERDMTVDIQEEDGYIIVSVLYDGKLHRTTTVDL